MAGLQRQGRERVVGERHDGHAALAGLARQVHRGCRVGGLRNRHQRVAGLQVVDLFGRRAAQPVDQQAIAAYQLVGVAHLVRDAERRAGAQEADLAGGQQGPGRGIEGGRRVERPDRADGLGLQSRQYVMAGRGAGVLRRLQFRGAVAPSRPAGGGQRLLEGCAEVFVAAAACRPRQAQHGGWRHAHGLGLPAHRPQADFGRVRGHPASGALQFGGQVVEQ
ncbi:Uncharacterised protein [Bordetella pertussis]|nr:Uncharacterised protein [Bordetella pertussis]